MNKLIFLYCFLVIILAVPIYRVNAQDAPRNTSMTIPKNQMTDSDYFAAGKSTYQQGTVNGDAYLTGETIRVEGTVLGDLLVAGGTITNYGHISQDVRIIGGDVFISGTIGRNVTVLAGSVTIADNAQILGNLVGLAGQMHIMGPVLRNMHLAASSLTIASAIGGDIRAAVGDFTVAPSSTISGSLTYWSDNVANIQAGSLILGGALQQKMPRGFKNPDTNVLKEKAEKGFASLWTLGKIVCWISSLLIGLLFLRLFPHYTKSVLTQFAHKPTQHIGIGIATLFILPILFVLLLISLIGIPFIGLLFIVVLLTMYVAHIYATLITGQFITDKFSYKLSQGYTFLLGSILFLLLSYMPIIGKLTMWIVSLGALGAILKYHYISHHHKNRSK